MTFKAEAGAQGAGLGMRHPQHPQLANDSAAATLSQVARRPLWRPALCGIRAGWCRLAGGRGAARGGGGAAAGARRCACRHAHAASLASCRSPWPCPPALWTACEASCYGRMLGACRWCWPGRRASLRCQSAACMCGAHACVGRRASLRCLASMPRSAGLALPSLVLPPATPLSRAICAAAGACRQAHLACPPLAASGVRLAWSDSSCLRAARRCRHGCSTMCMARPRPARAAPRFPTGTRGWAASTPLIVRVTSRAAGRARPCTLPVAWWPARARPILPCRLPWTQEACCRTTARCVTPATQLVRRRTRTCRTCIRSTCSSPSSSTTNSSSNSSR